MAEITAKAVMELRAKTGVSMMACKKALVEANGDMNAAIDILRKTGAAKAEKKGDRDTSEGAVAVSGGAAISLQCETDFVGRNDDFLALAQELADEAATNGEEAAKAMFEKKKTDAITKLGENITFGEAKVLKAGDTVGRYIHSNNKIAVVVAITGGTEDMARDVAMHIAASSPQVISPDEVDDTLVAKEKEIWTEQLKNEGKPEQIMEKILMGKEKKFREENALLKQNFVKNPDQTIEEFLGDATIEAFVRLEV